MKVLAIDTATERCSAALRVDGRVFQQAVETPRAHAELILPMVQALLSEAGLGLKDLDGIGYGRGPGAFTGVRIAIGVVQGLAFGAALPTAGISDLAAVAQQAARPGERILVCMDARMNEVYWAVFECNAVTGRVVPVIAERVGPPETVDAAAAVDRLAGTGFAAYPQLAAAFPNLTAHHILPHAAEIALLAEAELHAGAGRPAAEAQPVYLRDQVVKERGG